MPSRACRTTFVSFVLTLVTLAAVTPISAQERPATAPPAPTADDYARAEKIPGASGVIARRRRQRVGDVAARRPFHVPEHDG